MTSASSAGSQFSSATVQYQRHKDVKVKYHSHNLYRSSADPITLCAFLCEISALIAELQSQSCDRKRPKISCHSASEQDPHPEPLHHNTSSF